MCVCIYAATAKSLQSCPTLCDPIDGSPPGSPVPGILQERVLEWVAISFSNAWKWKVKVKLLSCVRLLATPWIAAYQAPPPMGFSRQEYWSGVPLPSPNTDLYIDVYTLMCFPGGTSGKESTCQCRRHKTCGFYPYYSCLENPIAEGPGGLQSVGLQRVGHKWNDLARRLSHIYIWLIYI